MPAVIMESAERLDGINFLRIFCLESMADKLLVSVILWYVGAACIIKGLI